MSYYLDFIKNVYSQNGEDGVIEKIFKDLEIIDGVVCEFGAWDGVIRQYNTGNNDVYFTSPEYNEFISKTKQELLQR